MSKIDVKEVAIRVPKELHIEMETRRRHLADASGNYVSMNSWVLMAIREKLAKK